nr:MAG TPA: hypothetical protein [Caudoviricetes sp.]
MIHSICNSFVIRYFHFPHSKAFFYRMHLRHTGGYSEK